MSMRGEFESKMAGEAMLDWDDGMQEYRSVVTQKMWITWQAARAADSGSQGVPDKEQLKAACTDFFYWWYNAPGNNTQQGFDEWFREVGFSHFTSPGDGWVIQLKGEYLATRGIWERPNHCGYTNDIHEAGRYSEAEAKKSEAMAPEKYKAVCLTRPQPPVNGGPDSE